MVVAAFRTRIRTKTRNRTRTRTRTRTRIQIRSRILGPHQSLDKDHYQDKTSA